MYVGKEIATAFENFKRVLQKERENKSEKGRIFKDGVVTKALQNLSD
jgi:DNA-directed RNA polymerase subunit N (RpoN/RPB10)